MSFSKGKDDSSSTDFASKFGGSKVEAFLGKGSKVVGTLNFTGPVELDGYIEGEINAQEQLTIGESATINAKIKGGEVIVKGTVNGDISASKRLILKKPAKVIGNITSGCVSIEEGVIFEGNCSMKGATQSSSSDKAKVA